MKPKVLFVGSNPSSSSPDSSPMHPSTKSRRILDKWTIDLDIEVYYCNVSDIPTINNKPLCRLQIMSDCIELSTKVARAGCDYVVALGNTASFALDYISVEHLQLPHPSGLNRKLNDKETVDDIKMRLRNMIESRNNIEILNKPNNGGNHG